jgi:hypothetical protein
VATTASAPATDVDHPAHRRRARVPSRGRAIVILLVIAVAFRIATMALYFPAVMMSVDSPRFARVSPPDIFGDYWMPAGYAAFLKVLHVVSDQVWFSIAVQHLIGVAAGFTVYLAVRRLEVSPGLATLAAAVPLLSGDVLYLEHWFMSDVFLLDMTVFALAAAVYGLVPRMDTRWLVVSGSLAAAAALSRSVGTAVVLVIAGCAACWIRQGWRRRLIAGGAVVVGAAVIFGGYLLAFEIKNGRYLGMTDMAGWNLYARVAPFADCSRFTAPPGTRVLCERTPPDRRFGALGYVWDANSVARRNFEPVGPKTGAPLESFAKQVILHQPGDYAVAVGTDLLRYVEPSAGSQRGYSGQGRELVSFGYRDPTIEKYVTSALAARYSGTGVSAPGLHTLTVNQQLFRVDRLWLLVFLILTVVGIWVLRGPTRLGVALFGATSVALYVLPTMTVSYDFRYGIPPGVLLAISGVIALAGLLDRARGRRAVDRFAAD